MLVRRLHIGDAPMLEQFYNTRSPQSISTFKPLGQRTTLNECSKLIDRNSERKNFDVIALRDDRIVGWAFLWGVRTSSPKFGLVVADAVQGRGLGRRLMNGVLSTAVMLRLSRIVLTVVRKNVRAVKMYKKRNFVTKKTFVSREDGQTYLRMVWHSRQMVAVNRAN